MDHLAEQSLSHSTSEYVFVLTASCNYRSSANRLVTLPPSGEWLIEVTPGWCVVVFVVVVDDVVVVYCYQCTKTYP